MQQFHSYEVGKPFQAGVTRFPEGAHFSYGRGGLSLILFMSSPTATEIKGLSEEGQKEFALLVEKDVLFFLYRADGIPWGDAPFNWHITKPDARAMPPTLTATEGALLPIIVVDAATGIIRLMNLVSLSHDLTEVLFQSIRDQIASPLRSRAEYDAAIDQAYQCYSTTDAMVQKAIARCIGGLPPMEQAPTQQ